MPLLLQLNVPVQSAAATSLVLVLACASAGALERLVEGAMNLQYAGERR